MKITKLQTQKIHVLLPSQHKTDPEAKKRLVRQFTSRHDHSSTRNLTFDQANMLIKHLGGSAITYDNWALYDVENASHRKIRSICWQLGWTIFVPSKGRVDVDIYRLSEWLKSYRSPVQKPITKMSPKELSKVIWALESITQKQYS